MLKPSKAMLQGRQLIRIGAEDLSECLIGACGYIFSRLLELEMRQMGLAGHVLIFSSPQTPFLTSARRG